MSNNSNLDSFSVAAAIPILDSATNIHVVGAAEPGQIRGAVAHCELVNGTGGALTVTIDVNGVIDDVSVPTLSKERLSVWIPAGVTLKMTGSAVGVTCYGYVQAVS